MRVHVNAQDGAVARERKQSVERALNGTNVCKTVGDGGAEMAARKVDFKAKFFAKEGAVEQPDRLGIGIVEIAVLDASGGLLFMCAGGRVCGCVLDGKLREDADQFCVVVCGG